MKGYVEKIISEYPQMVREREHLKKQMEAQEFLSADELISAMSFSHPDGERIQSSDLSDKTARIALGYREKLERINEELIVPMQKRYAVLDEEIKFFENSIYDLPGELSKLMEALFLQRMTWSEVEQCFCISQSTIARYRKCAINQMVRDYQIRASKIEAEILS